MRGESAPRFMDYSMPDNSVQIAEIDDILNAGTTGVTVDGTTTKFDLDALRRRRAELVQSDTSGQYTKRSRVSSITLDSSW